MGGLSFFSSGSELVSFCFVGGVLTGGVLTGVFFVTGCCLGRMISTGVREGGFDCRRGFGGRLCVEGAGGDNRGWTNTGGALYGTDWASLRVRT